MRRTAAVLVMTAPVSSGVLGQQDRPDLSGNWRLDSAATAAVNGAGGAPADGGGAKAICGSDIRLAQTADQLFLERQLGERSLSAAFKLDGTVTKHSILGCRVLSVSMEREVAYLGVPSDMTAKTTWNGRTLVIQTRIVGGTADVQQALTLRSDNTLLIETTTVVSGVRGRPVSVVYRKESAGTRN